MLKDRHFGGNRKHAPVGNGASQPIANPEPAATEKQNGTYGANAYGASRAEDKNRQQRQAGDGCPE